MNNGTNNYNGLNNANNANYNPNINQNYYQNQIPNQNMNQGTIEDTDKEKKQTVILVVVIILSVIILTGLNFFAIIEYEIRKSITSAKPIIYLYPKEKTEVTVKLGNSENITCSYPKYIDGWDVIASPDGTLVDKETNRELYSLYWEGKYSKDIPMDEGFIVKGEDSTKFLEEKLAILGLNERESEEFIIYWLPKLEKNDYNFIRFAPKEEIDEIMPLELSVEPDSVIRVLMQFKAVDGKTKVKEQEIETPERKGFVVVEWGGTEI